MLKYKNKILFVILILFSFLFETKATHMVGGDFTYRNLGSGLFEITLTIRRDCQYGAPDAFFDPKASISVFNQDGSLLKEIGSRGGFLLDYVGNDTLQESLDVKCGILGSPVCVHEAIYRGRIYLPRPKVDETFILVYQRCCRNQTLLNIENPLETGNTYILEIDRFAYDNNNSSPAFKDWPDIYICAGSELNFDHSAYETDGDSLVYKLYTPSSGATINYPMPTTENVEKYTPFYATVDWASGYSLANVLGGADPLTIDPVTGILSGTPETVGQFLVGVMVEEYRDGKLISVVRRDFEYNVRPCEEPPVADFDVTSPICGSPPSDTLNIVNTSQNADSYKWYVYVHSTKEYFTYDNIKDLDFIYVLPDSKKDTFDITLDAYGSIVDCSDVITKQVIVIEDPLNVDFDYEITECYDDLTDS
ncbi:MAG: hypothetical protein R2771_10645 [Saprospiraceae bacterium]